MITIYTEHISPRLTYVCQCIFQDILEVDYRLTDDIESFEKAKHRLNYSLKDIPGSSFIKPHGLLFETGIRTQQISLGEEARFFLCESDVAKHDVLAASFFLLSRYEEYLEKSRDHHGRFSSSFSLMGKVGVLHRPLVDEWALELYASLRQLFPALPASTKQFKQLSSFDIDVAYAYKGRNWWRRSRSFLNDLKKFNFSRIKERKQVLKGEMEDPYDSYAYLKSWHEKHKLDAHFFFLLGNYGPLDKNLFHGRNELKDLINDLGSWAEIGIHPSMGANSNSRQLAKEFKRFKKLSGHSAESSRQHFLYLDLPHTYRHLIAQGVQVDYSMGYADHVGFRAGTSHAFRWYDLQNETQSELYLLPITAMDSSLMDYQGLSIEEAKRELQKLKEAVKKVNGTYVTLWHNHTVSDQGEWKGWREVFESGCF